MTSRLTLLAAALTLAANSAAAQGWGLLTQEGGAALAGASYCGTGPSVGDHCVIVGCSAGEPVGLYVGAPALAQSGLRDATLIVDGLPITSLAFEDDPLADDLLYASLDRDDVAGVLGPLRAGVRFALRFQQGAKVLTLQGPLDGSSRAIAAALSACPLPRPAAIADPEALARAEVEAECAQMGQAAVFDQALSRAVDLDGTDPVDLVVDYAGAGCTGMTSFYCGSGGCSQILYLAEPGGGFRQIHADTMYGIEVGPPGTIRMMKHGSVCDRVGAAGCTVTYRIDDGELVFVGRE